MELLENHHSILFIIGLSAFVGLFGSWFFQKIKFPQVVGYIVVGIVLGKSCLGIITEEHILNLKPLTLFALGIIGFLVGGELKISEFKKYGKQFFAILFGEGISAFILVTLLSSTVFYLLSRKIGISVAGGVVLGAVASATDPASTISVLWEYRTKGMVTTALIAIVALDDALAMSLYALGKSSANFLIANEVSILKEISKISIELLGSIIVAAIAAFIIKYIIDIIDNKDKLLAITMCTLFLIIGICVSFSLDVILSSMFFGFIVANINPQRSENIFERLKSVSTPIYVIFFVLVGARFNISNVPPFVWLMSLLYVVGRSVGKFLGTYYGAKISKSDERVKKYTGLGLFAQGGVAIGLAIMASENMHSIMIMPNLNLGNCIISIVTVTTIVVQLIGPPITKIAVSLAKEIDKDITEEDIMDTMDLKEIIISDLTPIREDDSIDIIIKKFSNSDYSVKIVIDKNGDFIGTISFDALKDALPDNDLCVWLLGTDIMDDNVVKILSNYSVKNTIRLMENTEQYTVVVIDSNNEKKAIGIIELLTARRIIKQKILKKIHGSF